MPTAQLSAAATSLEYRLAGNTNQLNKKGFSEMEMFTQCITISGSIKEWEDAIMPTFVVKNNPI